MSNSEDHPSGVDVHATAAQGRTTQIVPPSPKEKSSGPPSIIDDSSDSDSSMDEGMDDNTRKVLREMRKKFEKRGMEKAEKKYKEEKEKLSFFGYHQVPHDHGNFSHYPPQVFYSVNLEKTPHSDGTDYLKLTL